MSTAPRRFAPHHGRPPAQHAIRGSGRDARGKNGGEVSEVGSAGGNGGFAATGTECPAGRRGGVDDMGFAIGGHAGPGFMDRLSARLRDLHRTRRAMRPTRWNGDDTSPAAALVGDRRDCAWLAQLA
ncbi:hypothetical protein [Burkholderia gladioli]|uniref:hypothetical protein n=1 Tax=Burkholderia gladioli TaxID=28095 RepID=UPI0020B21446|nr:hypothetical protein [Burkholderia gladioli]